jgi:sugar O-acyltransferase (sialic acid O-acetyltransferase NeuD family)
MKRALIGNGGHAREVMAQMEEIMTRFVDDKYYTPTDPMVLPLSEFSPGDFEVMIAVGESNSRSEIASRLPSNTRYFSYAHPTSRIMGECELGDGYFIGANCILTCDIKIGNHLIMNRGNHIGHDCNIGSFFSLMPGAIISGNVDVGDRVYIGTNSSVREKIRICDDVVIGLNTGIIKSITSSGTYAGNPIKKIS